jgi:hypothetical protein
VLFYSGGIDCICIGLSLDYVIFFLIEKTLSIFLVLFSRLIVKF